MTLMYVAVSFSMPSEDDDTSAADYHFKSVFTHSWDFIHSWACLDYDSDFLLRTAAYFLYTTFFFFKLISPSATVVFVFCSEFKRKFEGRTLYFNIQLLSSQTVKHHSKVLTRKCGISFAMYGKWLTSLVINDLLETSKKDTNF